MFEWFDSLQQRERRIVAIGSVIALVMIAWLIVGPLYGNLERLENRVEKQAADLETMRGIASQVGQIPNRPTTADSMVLIMQNTARARNLQIDNYQPSGTKSINASLDDVSFDAMIEWLGDLDNRYGMRVQNASIRRGSDSGTVNSQLVLIRN